MYHYFLVLVTIAHPFPPSPLFPHISSPHAHHTTTLSLPFPQEPRHPQYTSPFHSQERCNLCPLHPGVNASPCLSVISSLIIHHGPNVSFTYPGDVQSPLAPFLRSELLHTDGRFSISYIKNNKIKRKSEQDKFKYVSLLVKYSVTDSRH